ncbi:MAG: acetyl-CoA carboxylase biotin carboxyl carrier protein subunit [Rikenellaceae bacterium]|jgi:biotin carboxyl carrier protein|nr:acetyl-CoA carboxylase biotin carboxyl carrier protein subunit [Rikenellaceae bacterium]
MSEEKKYDIIETRHGSFKTTLNKMYLGRKPWQPADPKQILSFMPGMVIEFNVKPGDKVRKGDQLALFKAMKMNNKILAPMDGVIKAVCVEPGVNIAKNVLMIELQ